MTTNSPSDAGVINIKGTDRSLAMTVDCNPRYVHADPEIGTQIAVSEAARNIVCSGGEPSAITNCLNFGNPYSPEVYWQFVGAIKGMSSACKMFQTPVTGGNVSFYNQTSIGGSVEPVFPTPAIGMIGTMSKENKMSLDFKKKGHVIFLIGQSQNDIASSQYLVSEHGVKASPAPYFNLNEEYLMQESVKGLISNKLIHSAHDVSDGGLFTALVESAICNNLGFDITTDAEIRKDAFLFGEAQGRVIVTVSQSNEDEFIDFMRAQAAPFVILGHVTKQEIRIDDISFGFISDFKELYNNSLGKILS
jgi:phosphoribosylformylglycinamidine synthase